MSPARIAALVALVLALLVAGMMSATLLDFEPGAWVAFGALMFLAVGRFFGLLPFAGWMDGSD